MKTYYKYKGMLVDLEKHFGGVCEIVTNKCLVILLNGIGGKKYIPLKKVVFDFDLTDDYRKLIKENK